MDYEMDETARHEMQWRADLKKQCNDCTVNDLYKALGKLIEMGHGNAFVTVTDYNNNDISIPKKEYTEEDVYNAVGTDYKEVWLRMASDNEDLEDSD